MNVLQLRLALAINKRAIVHAMSFGTTAEIYDLMLQRSTIKDMLIEALLKQEAA